MTETAGMGPFFVRFTYQECRAVGPTGGGYETLSIEQDIRMMDGFFELSDDRSALQYNIVAGKLHRIPTSPSPAVMGEK